MGEGRLVENIGRSLGVIVQHTGLHSFSTYMIIEIDYTERV